MSKIFAKPFIACLDGHNDSICSIARSRTMMAPCFTGAHDGEVRFWNIAHKKCFKAIRAHAGAVRAMGITADDTHILSCGDDKTVKVWKFDRDEAAGELNPERMAEAGAYQFGEATIQADDVAPVVSFHTPSLVSGVDCHASNKDSFATACEGTVELWNVNRPGGPLQSFEWNVDGLRCVKFNLAEECLLGVTGSDNSVMLFDVRAKTGIRKVVLQNRSNAFCWNPREPNFFAVANEDSNLYSFDMRKLSHAVRVHKGHLGAVTDVDYSGTGRELVSAGFDKTIRLWSVNQSRSLDIYHTKRMQKVFSTKFSGDARMILSGSEDGGLRVWKAKADAKLGNLCQREKEAVAYRETLKRKYGHMDEVRKISKNNRLPKYVKSQTKKKQVQMEAQFRKQQNIEKHSKPGSYVKPDMAKKMVVREEE